MKKINVSLEYAIQQFIGFIHGSRGYDIESLVSAMGLDKNEWSKIKKELRLSLRDTEIKDLDKYFKN